MRPQGVRPAVFAPPCYHRLGHHFLLSQPEYEVPLLCIPLRLTTGSHPPFQEGTSVNVFLWVLQVVLAAAFASAGYMKVAHPQQKLFRLRLDEGLLLRTVSLIDAVKPGAVGLNMPAASVSPQC
jgi:hypothetical protein